MSAVALARHDTEDLGLYDTQSRITTSGAQALALDEPIIQPSEEQSKLETAQTDEFASIKSSTQTFEQVKTTTRLKIEADYYGVINSVDLDDKMLSAVIYEKTENVVLMEVDIPFTEFQESDHALFKQNSVFYWQIGKKLEYKQNKRGSIKQSQTNFSSLRMRRVFVDMKKQDKRVQSLSNKYKNIFQCD